jgi:pimeloyl-ACP methyl ester carboxylesterase
VRLAVPLLAIVVGLVPAGSGLAEAKKDKKERWQTIPLPPAMPKAEASGHVELPDGAQIYWASYGTPAAPPVILLHGGLGNGDHFGFQVPALVDKFRVIAIDSRGQGRSTLGKSKTKLSYHSMAGDVIAVMDALALKRASIVGWSDGGAIALDLGIHYQDRVEKLFVFGTNYDAKGSKSRSGYSPTFAAYGAKCRSDFAKLSKSPKSFDAVATALLPVWRDPGSFTKDQLRSIQAHTLISDGDRDEIIVLDQIKEMAALIPNGKLVIFRDTSHFALWQDPTTFNQALVDFLTSP